MTVIFTGKRKQRLNLMIDREVTYRSNNKIQRLLKTAKLKLQACPEDIDYRHPRGLEKNQFASLLSCRWIEQHQNVLITGPTGCGKTYLGCVLATQACKLGYSVRYYRSSRLLDNLAIAHGDGRFSKLIAQIAKTDLLILDDWGLESLTLGQRNDVLELMEDCHGARSTLITSQVPVQKWHAAIGDATLADAILDTSQRSPDTTQGRIDAKSTFNDNRPKMITPDANIITRALGI